jgi:ubiquinone/menaquinone biosynthesis C-methylase UbiE
MLLNRIETAMMNNPVRAALQRHFEVPRLRAMGGPLPGGNVLEVGCGCGVGTGLIFDHFHAEHVDAFDLDPEMVALAKKRLAPRGARVRLWSGDVTRIEAPDEAYDAIFDFGIIHHVPAWRDALREVHRVLRPGGRFYAEEVLARFIGHPVWRRLLAHPQHDRFDHDTFRAALDDQGFRIVASNEVFGQFAWFVADKPGSATADVASSSPRTSDQSAV